MSSISNIYAPKQRNALAKLLNREKKMATICILDFWRHSVTYSLPYIVAIVYTAGRFLSNVSAMVG